MQIGLFEDKEWERLYPFTRLRPVWHLWWGMDRLSEKWQRYFGWEVVGFLPARAFLHKAFPPVVPSAELVWINARLLPLREELRQWIEQLPPEKAFFTPEGTPVAFRSKRGLEELQAPWERLGSEVIPSEVPLTWLKEVTDLFELSGEVIAADWKHLRERSSELPKTLSVRGRDNIFFHPTARAGFAILDAESGPIWIGPHAEIQDGAILQHTNTIGPHTVIMLGARLRTHNSIGPYCKVGGEIGQSTFLGYSNKAHDGFLGHSVIGEWCNIGAGSNSSNLKNTYGPVRLYDPAKGALRETGLQFCGLIMGDYARCGIQTAFTTGCMVDIFANVVGTGFTPKYIPPFWWGEGSYWRIEKALETARRMKSRRGQTLSPEEEELLRYHYTQLVEVSGEKHHS
ncbi:MAG: putative sugar nucleotidyl transferase [Bacteroidia bacterium]|nr:putative sugar nucleotidyl transferase [Bacteroidia bacterium]MCX7764774.1 putative sugar nucleotidyl transferase [Bacteroidia bacterium]MDW8057626.1 putative sugar nucleotidyl transferase [Bacteroidia bacterium]